MPVTRHRVFVSYSHRDRRHLNRLQVHLRPIEREGLIDLWDDTRLTPGSQWRREIASAVTMAKVAVLLVSADFLASPFIVENELPPILKAAHADGATVLPVIVGACRFTSVHELAAFQAVNDPSRPVAVLPVAERERVWVRVAESVEATLAGRAAEEGWIVANEKPVLEAVRQLVAEGQDGGFVVFSVGDYYVQLLTDRANSILHFEAVSDTYLPLKLKLGPDSVRPLLSLGFKQPDNKNPNYHRVFTLDEAQASLSSIAGLAVKVMAEVYEVSQNSKLEIRLDLKG